MSRTFSSSKPCHWVQPRPHSDASLRFMKHGPILPMDYGRPGFAVRLLAFGLSPLRGLRRAASLARGR
jgi:hypothetical protein